MISSISIKNLRGIREGYLTGFTPLVVLVGPNSAGKSTILDAIVLGVGFIQSGFNPLEEIAARRRGLEQAHKWLLFRRAGVPASEAEITVWSDASTPRRAVLEDRKRRTEKGTGPNC